jgi:hypothetical protein
MHKSRGATGRQQRSSRELHDLTKGGRKTTTEDECIFTLILRPFPPLSLLLPVRRGVTPDHAPARRVPPVPLTLAPRPALSVMLACRAFPSPGTEDQASVS